MNTRAVLLISAAFELATGIALVAAPNLVASILLFPGAAAVWRSVDTAGGIWFSCLRHRLLATGRRRTSGTNPQKTLFLYNLVAAVYLGYLRIAGEFAGLLLLLACIFHALLALLLAKPANRSFIDRDPAS